MRANVGAHHANIERAGGYAKWAAGTALDHSGDFAPNAIATGLNVFGNWTGLGVSTDVNGSLSVGFISQRQQVLSTLAWAVPELLGATRVVGATAMRGFGDAWIWAEVRITSRLDNSGALVFTTKTAPGVKYIGKLDDLLSIPRSQTLLDDLPNLGSARANYYQNSSILRKALRDGYEIRDASAFRLNSTPDPTLLWPNRRWGKAS